MFLLYIPALKQHCEANVTSALLAIDGNASLGFDFASHKLTLDSVAAVEEIKQALEAAGYPVEAIDVKSAGGGCHCDMCD